MSSFEVILLFFKQVTQNWVYAFSRFAKAVPTLSTVVDRYNRSTFAGILSSLRTYLCVRLSVNNLAYYWTPQHIVDKSTSLTVWQTHLLNQMCLWRMFYLVPVFASSFLHPASNPRVLLCNYSVPSNPCLHVITLRCNPLGRRVKFSPIRQQVKRTSYAALGGFVEG